MFTQACISPNEGSICAGSPDTIMGKQTSGPLSGIPPAVVLINVCAMPGSESPNKSKLSSFFIVSEYDIQPLKIGKLYVNKILSTLKIFLLLA